VTTGIPAVLWYVVLLGAGLTFGLLWMFDMRLGLQLVMGGMLAFFTGTVICLIASMDYPFRGEVSIGPEAYQEVYDDLMEGTSTLGLGPRAEAGTAAGDGA
jgi:hypothetical protein